jgi:hypothetical protein
MSEIEAIIEPYLHDGRYGITRSLTNSRTGQTKVMLTHVNGEAVDGRETLWLPLLDEEDEAFARERFRNKGCG